MNIRNDNLVNSENSKIKHYKNLILVVLLGIVLCFVCIVLACEIFASSGSKKNDVLDDNIICKKIRTEFIKTLKEK
ncbi:hypothetical protein CWI37_0981p0010, partial [Hamiltosporidium tvaerminnensis]